MSKSLDLRLKNAIRSVPDFPKPGIMFRDITTLLCCPDLMGEAIEALFEPFAGRTDAIAGIESRGFLVGAAMAWKHGLPFVPLRKPGKLPAKTWRETYDLEYGTDALEMHCDGLRPGQRVLIVDDLLATGGTAAAATRLIQRAECSVSGLAFLVELSFLKGRGKLEGFPIRTLVVYDSEQG